MSTRTILGVIAVSLTVTSVFAMVLFVQNFAPQSISNPSGLNIVCSTVTDSVSSNSSTGGHQLFTLTYTCGGGPLTSTSQSVLSIAASGNYVPTFTIDTSSSTASITSTSLALLGNSIQSGALWCVSGNPTYPLTSGTAVALTSSLSCQNGTSVNAINVYYYKLDIVVSSFGTINVSAFSVTWTNA